MEQIRTLLAESEMPTHWYNTMADLPRPLDPPVNPATKQPAGPEDFAFLKEEIQRTLASVPQL